jgi:transcription initiation factor IIE alpha subunit
VKFTSVKCDNCKKKFEIKELKKCKVKNDIEKVYFVCPYCGAEYRSFYTNRKSRKIQYEINKLREKIKSDPKNTEQYMREIKSKTDKLQSIMKKLIAEIEN